MRVAWLAAGALGAILTTTATGEPKQVTPSDAFDQAWMEVRLVALERLGIRASGGAYALILKDVTARALASAEAANPAAVSMQRALAERAQAYVLTLPTTKEVNKVAPPPWVTK